MTLAPLDPAAEFVYSPQVRELFADLRHAGSLTATEALLRAGAGSFEQGAQVLFQLAVHQGQVQVARYSAYGCPHFLAACELLARWLEGRDLGELPGWRWRELEASLQAPASKRSRWLLLEDVVTQLAKTTR